MTHIAIRIGHKVTGVQLDTRLIGVNLQHASRMGMHDPSGEGHALLGALGDAEVVIVALARSSRHGRTELPRNSQIVWRSADAQELARRDGVLVRFRNAIGVQRYDVAVHLLVARVLKRYRNDKPLP